MSKTNEEMLTKTKVNNIISRYSTILQSPHVNTVIHIIISVITTNYYNHAYIHTTMHTYIHTYNHTYIQSYMHTYILSSLFHVSLIYSGTVHEKKQKAHVIKYEI